MEGTGEAEWVHVWKGFGALFGADVFTALASRRCTKSPHGTIPKENDTEDSGSNPQPVRAWVCSSQPVTSAAKVEEAGIFQEPVQTFP